MERNNKDKKKMLSEMIKTQSKEFSPLNQRRQFLQ